jgi:DNA-binding MarR family transcriptional regulator
LAQQAEREQVVDTDEQLEAVAGALASTKGQAMREEARRLYRDRRRRSEIFGTESLFGEPAWDILLDLFIAAIAGERRSVTDACVGAAVPMTTALRWLQTLERKGLIVRNRDPKDSRRNFVSLSTKGINRMAEVFSTWGVIQQSD